MKKPQYSFIKNTKEYDELLSDLYVKVKKVPEEITLPSIHVISVDGNEPPQSKQYQNAIGALYSIAYTLKMGLKFHVLPRPHGYFDYKVGALETMWWSTQGELEIQNPQTLRWKAYLMVPKFVTKKLFEEAQKQAQVKKPGISCGVARLEKLREGNSIQILHIGPYDQEKASVDKLLGYMDEHSFAPSGHHHEIYMSDPRRTKPEKLKTVIRYPVQKRKK